MTNSPLSSLSGYFKPPMQTTFSATLIEEELGITIDHRILATSYSEAFDLAVEYARINDYTLYEVMAVVSYGG